MGGNRGDRGGDRKDAKQSAKPSVPAQRKASTSAHREKVKSDHKPASFYLPRTGKKKGKHK